MAFEIKSQNIKIQLTSIDNIGVGENNKDRPTKLPLNVKKYILINQNASFWQTIKQDFGFSGNTKEIEFDKAKIDEFLQKIRDDNFANSANDESYKNAPLEIQFQIGDLLFTNITELNDYLLSQKDDLITRTIKFKFTIKENNQLQWDVIDQASGKNIDYLLWNDNVCVDGNSSGETPYPFHLATI